MVSVSVVIPHFNSPDLLAAAIESILEQTVLPNELIVVDDASAPRHLKKIESICRDADQGAVSVRLLRNEVNVGPAACRNSGWDDATGTLVAFLDSDDIWHPKKLEITGDFFDRDDDLEFLCHPVVYNEETWEVADGQPGSRSLNLLTFLIRNRASTPSVVVRRRLKFKFPTNRRFSEDYELWLRMAIAGVCMLEIDTPLASVARSDDHAGLSSNQFKMAGGELLSIFRALRSRPKGWLLVAPTMIWSLMKAAVRIALRRHCVGRPARPEQSA